MSGSVPEVPLPEAPSSDNDGSILYSGTPEETTIDVSNNNRNNTNHNNNHRLNDTSNRFMNCVFQRDSAHVDSDDEEETNHHNDSNDHDSNDETENDEEEHRSELPSQSRSFIVHKEEEESLSASPLSFASAPHLLPSSQQHHPEDGPQPVQIVMEERLGSPPPHSLRTPLHDEETQIQDSSSSSAYYFHHPNYHQRLQQNSAENSISFAHESGPALLEPIITSEGFSGLTAEFINSTNSTNAPSSAVRHRGGPKSPQSSSKESLHFSSPTDKTQSLPGNARCASEPAAVYSSAFRPRSFSSGATTDKATATNNNNNLSKKEDKEHAYHVDPNEFSLAQTDDESNNHSPNHNNESGLHNGSFSKTFSSTPLFGDDDSVDMLSRTVSTSSSAVTRRDRLAARRAQRLATAQPPLALRMNSMVSVCEEDNPENSNSILASTYNGVPRLTSPGPPPRVPPLLGIPQSGGNNPHNQNNNNGNGASFLDSNYNNDTSRSNTSFGLPSPGGTLRSSRRSQHPGLNLLEMFPDFPETLYLPRDRFKVPQDRSHELGKGAFGKVTQGELYPPGALAPMDTPMVDALSIDTPRSHNNNNNGNSNMLLRSFSSLAAHRADAGELPVHQQPYSEQTAKFYTSVSNLQLPHSARPRANSQEFPRMTDPNGKYGDHPAARNAWSTPNLLSDGNDEDDDDDDEDAVRLTGADFSAADSAQFMQTRSTSEVTNTNTENNFDLSNEYTHHQMSHAEKAAPRLPGSIVEVEEEGYRSPSLNVSPTDFPLPVGGPVHSTSRDAVVGAADTHTENEHDDDGQGSSPHFSLSGTRRTREGRADASASASPSALHDVSDNASTSTAPPPLSPDPCMRTELPSPTSHLQSSTVSSTQPSPQLREGSLRLHGEKLQRLVLKAASSDSYSKNFESALQKHLYSAEPDELGETVALPECPNVEDISLERTNDTNNTTKSNNTSNSQTNPNNTTGNNEDVNAGSFHFSDANSSLHKIGSFSGQKRSSWDNVALPKNPDKTWIDGRRFSITSPLSPQGTHSLHHIDILLQPEHGSNDDQVAAADKILHYSPNKSDTEKDFPSPNNSKTNFPTAVSNKYTNNSSHLYDRSVTTPENLTDKRTLSGDGGIHSGSRSRRSYDGEFLPLGAVPSSAYAEAVDSGRIPFRSVAIKSIHKLDLTRPAFHKAFYNEVLMAHQLHHPCLVNIYGVSEDEDDFYFVMDLAENGNLDSYMKKFGVRDTREMAPRFLADVVLALEYLRDGSQHLFVKPLPEHQQLESACNTYNNSFALPGEDTVTSVMSIPETEEEEDQQQQLSSPSHSDETLRKSIVVHKDLKPENILLTWDFHLKLGDFGAGCFLGDETANTFAGSPSYMAPEVILHGKASPYSDLWSLGCVLYELLEGHALFSAATNYLVLQQVRQYKPGDAVFSVGASEHGKQLVFQLLQPTPEKRLGSERTGGFEALKKHPFFAEIDWNCVLEMTNITTHNTDYTTELSDYLRQNEKVVFCSPVDVLACPDAAAMAPSSGDALTILVLTDKPRLFLVDPAQEEPVLNIPCSTNLTVTVQSVTHFAIVTPKIRGTFKLEDLNRRADLWGVKIAETMRRHKTSTRSNSLIQQQPPQSPSQTGGFKLHLPLQNLTSGGSLLNRMRNTPRSDRPTTRDAQAPAPLPTSRSSRGYTPRPFLTPIAPSPAERLGSPASNLNLNLSQTSKSNENTLMSATNTTNTNTTTASHNNTIVNVNPNLPPMSNNNNTIMINHNNSSKHNRSGSHAFIHTNNTEYSDSTSAQSISVLDGDHLLDSNSYPQQQLSSVSNMNSSNVTSERVTPRIKMVLENSRSRGTSFKKEREGGTKQE